MRLVMLLISVSSFYLAWGLADGFLFAMGIFSLLLAFTVKYWDGKNG